MDERELIKIIIDTIVNQSVLMGPWPMGVTAFGINRNLLFSTCETLIKYSPERAKFLKKSSTISVPELNATIAELIKDYESTFAMYGITVNNGFPLYNNLYIAWETERGYYI